MSSRTYLGDQSSVTSAERDLIRRLAMLGGGIEVLTGSTLALTDETDPIRWLEARGWEYQISPLGEMPQAAKPDWPYPPSLVRLVADQIPVGLLRGPSVLLHDLDDAEVGMFVAWLDATSKRFRPDVLLAFGADRLTAASLEWARGEGMATALVVADAHALEPAAFRQADVVLVPSAFEAKFYHEAFGRSCVVVPSLVENRQMFLEQSEPVPGHVTFLGSSMADGVAVAARIAEGLSRQRPDIPFRTWNGDESESAVADLAGSTQVAALPSLDWANHPRAVIAMMRHGVPVVASDRGALPELLGDAGILLSLPDRLTPATLPPPDPDEVAPWVSAIVRLWDDAAQHAEYQRRARERARRWEPSHVVEQYIRVIRDLRSGPKPTEPPPPGRARMAVLVPHLSAIEPECEEGLRQLEREGVRVDRRRGSSAIDAARNEMVSDALHDGFESILFIDADIGFHPDDALRLLARPEPVISGLYPKKGRREMASVFAEGIDRILLGPDAPGSYPLRYAATGFLRIRAGALRRMIAELDLQLCNQRWGRGVWPFFLPLPAPLAEGGVHYLSEDWAFSHRLRQIGITPLVDTSFRLRHYGSYGYTWEDAGSDRPLYRNYEFRI